MNHAESSALYPTFACLCICVFIATLDTVIVAPSLPAIAHSLNATSSEAYWCGSGFLFAQTVTQPVFGGFSETFGHKACLMIAILVFTIANLFCAAAQSIEWLVAARVFQGIGSAGINVLANVITADLVPVHRRANYTALVSLFGACGLCAGVVIGGAVSEKASWRWIFWINLPVCVPTMFAMYFSLHRKPLRMPIRSGLEIFDWRGLIFLVGSLIALLYGVTGGGVLAPWLSPSILTSLTLGTVGLVSTGIYEVLWANSPMIPPRIFLGGRNATLGYLTATFQGLVLWTYAYFITHYFTVTKEHSLMGSAVLSLAAIAAFPIGAALGGVVITLLKHFKWANTVAAAVMTIGFALMSRLNTRSQISGIIGFQLLAGLGGGVLFPGRLIAVQACQDPEDLSIATALVSFFTSLGTSLGVAIGGAVFQNRWAAEVGRRVDNMELPVQFIISKERAEQTSAIMKSFPHAIRELYKGIMADTVSMIWIVVASFAGLALLACASMTDTSIAKVEEEIEMSREVGNLNK